MPDTFVEDIPSNAESKASMIDSYGHTLYNGEQPAGCCGAAWRFKVPKRITADKGIHIIAGHVGSNARRINTELSHIVTRNGPLTIVIKHLGN